MKPLKGLHRDSQPIDQPQGTYRNAQNALINKKIGAISSEEGNIERVNLSADLPSSLANYTLIGNSLVYDGRQILFFAGNIGTVEEGNSEIGIFNGTSYTQIVRNATLNFQPDSNLEAVNIINNQNEVVVYWTDDINPPRFYNIDSAEAITDIDRLNIFPTVDDAPLISLDQVNPGGGQLLSGAYHFAIALYDEDDSRTNYMSVTPPVYVNDDSDPANHDTYDGVAAGTQTSKSIRLNITNLDDSYSEFELVVIRKEGNTIAEVSKISRQTINSVNNIFNYTGGEETTSSSLNEILINTAVYETAKSITEQDNTLYMGNLTRKPDIGYQKYANNITVESVVTNLDDGGTGLLERDHYGNPVLSFYDKSFKRGGVYALYIAFILENGQDSKAYHIPGRQADAGEKNDTGDYLRYQVYGDNGTNGMGFWENKDEIYPNASEDEDDDFLVYDVDSNGDPVDPGGGALGDTTIQGQNVRHHHFPDAHTTGMSFWDGTEANQHGKKLGIKLSDIKIPKDIIDRVRGVKILYARRDDTNQRIIDQGIGFPLRVDDNPPAGVKNRALMYTRGSGNQSSSNESEGLYFQAFNSLRTRKNIGSAGYIKEVAQPTGASFSDGDGDREQVFFEQTKKMYYGDGRIFPIKAISYLEANSYISGVSKGFSYDIDNTQAEEAIAIEVEDPDTISWDGGGRPWLARNINADEDDETYPGRIFELIQLLDNMYFPFDQQELIWTGLQINNVDLFDPRTTGGSSGVAASGSLDITGAASNIASDPEAVLTIDTLKPASGYIEVTSANFKGTEDHTVNVDGNTAGPITIYGQPGLVNTQDILTNSPDPNSISFKSDGTKVFILSENGDDVDEYSMSTAWDTSTMTYVQTFDLSTQDTAPRSLFIGSAGTKMYVVGVQNNNVYEYNLSTAWDVSTATLANTFDISTQTTTATGLGFKSDGTVMYIADTGGTIYEYTFTTAWDTTTASASGTTVSISIQDSDISAIFFKGDGTKMFAVGRGNDNIYEYTLSTAWDLTTLTYQVSLDISGQDLNPDGLYIGNTGSKLYYTGLDNDNIYEHDMYTAWTVATTDTIQDIVTKYRDAINGDVTISADWTATVADQGGGTWRTVITSDAEGSTWNGRTIDVTGETNVSLTTSNTSGGQTLASAGDIGVTFSAPHGTFEINTTLAGGETADQVATALRDAFEAEPVFTYAFTTVLDTAPDNPTITITAISNGSFFNSAITLDATTTDVIFTKDGDIDGGSDTGSLEDRYPIGFISVGGVISSGDIDIDFPDPFFSSTTVTIDVADDSYVTAQKIATALQNETLLDDLTIFAYEDRCYYWKPNSFDYDGIAPTIDTSGTGDINANPTAIDDGRVGDGDPDTVTVIISTPGFSGSVDVNISPGDSAATVENAVLNALQAWVGFNNHFSATGTDPISVVADTAGDEYNGPLDLDPKGTGITYNASDLSGGTDGDATDFTIEECYGGDTFISFYGTRASIWSWYGSGGEMWRHLAYFPCESYDNIKLRHTGDSYEEIYYPKSTYDEIISLEIDAPSDIKEGRNHQDFTLDNYIAYNPDYSSHASIKTAIPFGIDQINIEEFPTRIIRSAEGEETQGDAGIRTFLEADYLDFTKSHGPLTKISVVDNNIIAHMNRSLIRTKSREEMVTGDIRTYIGAGDIFSVKPDELVSTETGFAGLQDPRTAIVTPLGYFFVDRDARKVFLVNQGPKEISSLGMRNFFEDRLSDYDEDNDSLKAVWDDKWDRIILTYIDSDDSTKSFTLSYYPQLEIWGSFHTYKPEYYLQGLDTFFSLTADIIYEHNDGNSSCSLNGVTEDFIFEFVDNRSPVQSKYFANIEFITEVVDESVDPPSNFFKETFDQFRIKNSYQDSGDQAIVYFDQAGGNARNVEGTWKINKFRDLLVNGVIDNNKPWQDRSRLIGKYAQVELIYNNSGNKFLYLHDVKVGMRVSRR